MKELNLLAFDLGASGGRAVAGRFDGRTLTMRIVHQFPNRPVEADGHLHWDVRRLVEEIMRGASLAGEGGTDAIGIDTWGVDYGLLDASGELLGDPYHYRDARTADVQELAFERMPAEEIYERTGIAFHPFNTLFQLLETRLTRPEVLDRARSMLMMPDLLAWLLTGERATEYTIASTSQLLDARTRHWCDELIDAMDLPRRIFTDICQPGTIRGTLRPDVAERAGLGAVAVAAVAGHDTASAVAAVPDEGENCAYLSSGTWSLLGVETAEPVISAAALRYNFTNEGGPEGTYRLLRNIAGLWPLQECKRQWEADGPETTYEELLALARRSEPLACLIDPDDETFYSPGDMPERIRRYSRNAGRRVPQTTGAVVRCILESLALKYRWAVEKLEEIVGRRIDVLQVVGGGARNELLNEFTAGALNRPVICGPTEATAVGNLMMQAAALGEVSGLADIRRVVGRSFPQVRCEPREPARWDQAYAEFTRLLKE